MNPTQKLVDIDVDGVLPKDKDEKKCLKYNGDDRAFWYNQSNAEHRKLGVEIDVELLAQGIKDVFGVLTNMTACRIAARKIATHKGVIKLVKLTP